MGVEKEPDKLRKAGVRGSFSVPGGLSDLSTWDIWVFILGLQLNVTPHVSWVPHRLTFYFDTYHIAFVFNFYSCEQQHEFLKDRLYPSLGPHTPFSSHLDLLGGGITASRIGWSLQQRL